MQLAECRRVSAQTIAQRGSGRETAKADLFSTAPTRIALSRLGRVGTGHGRHHDRMRLTGDPGAGGRRACNPFLRAVRLAPDPTPFPNRWKTDGLGRQELLMSRALEIVLGLLEVGGVDSVFFDIDDVHPQAIEVAPTAQRVR